MVGELESSHAFTTSGGRAGGITGNERVIAIDKKSALTRSLELGEIDASDRRKPHIASRREEAS